MSINVLVEIAWETQLMKIPASNSYFKNHLTFFKSRNKRYPFVGHGDMLDTVCRNFSVQDYVNYFMITVMCFSWLSKHTLNQITRDFSYSIDIQALLSFIYTA